MPRPRRNDIGRRSRRTQNRSNERQNQSQEEREIQNQNQRERMARSRSGEDVLIPRIPLIPPDLALDFKRLQFPIRLAFAMTINKAQGQSLELCGIDLEYPCFSHGQLYVSCSRVGKPSVLFIYTTTQGKTKNVVYEKALR